MCAMVASLMSNCSPPIFRFTVQSMQYKIQVLMFILPITTFHHRFIFGINSEAYPGMLQTFVKSLAIVFSYLSALS